MAEYVDFHYMPLEGKITGKQVLKQTEDAINDLGEKVYSIDIDSDLIQQAIDDSQTALDTAEEALSVVTTDRAIWYNNVGELIQSNAEAGVTIATKGYYIPNDGGNGFYIVRNKQSADVNDGGSIIFMDSGRVAELIVTDEVNINQFGGVGDGTTDDNTAIVNAVAYASAKNYRLVFLEGRTYLTSAGIVIANPPKEIRMDGRLSYRGSGTALTIGQATTDLGDLVLKLNVTGVYTHTANSNGVLLYNVNNSQIYIYDVRYFGDTAVEFRGSNSKGFCYNSIFIGIIFSTPILLKLNAVDSGWVNENKFFGGRFAIVSSDSFRDTVIAVLLTGTNTTHIINNNIFYSPCMELKNGVKIEYGSLNRWYDVRTEGNTNPFEITGASSCYNYMSASYGSSAVSTWKSTMRGLGLNLYVDWYDTLGQYFEEVVFDSGDVSKNIASDGTRTSWAKLINCYQGNTDYTDASVNSVTIDNGNLKTLTGYACLGAKFNAINNKSFMFRAECVGKYRIIVFLWDSDGNLITDGVVKHTGMSGTNIESLTPYSQATAGKNGYITGGDTTDNYFRLITVPANCAKAFFGILGNNVVIKRMQVKTKQMEDSILLQNYETAILSSIPTSAGKVGQFVKKTTPTVDCIGWVYDGTNWLSVGEKGTWLENVASLRSANLPVGIVVSTKGYYSANDGGNGTYNIRAASSDVDDGGSIIILDNGNVAELIVDNGKVNIKQFGAYGDNTHDDTDAIVACAVFCRAKKYILYSDESTYKTTTDCVIVRVDQVELHGTFTYLELTYIHTQSNQHIQIINNATTLVLRDYKNTTFHIGRADDIQIIADYSKVNGSSFAYCMFYGGYWGTLSIVGGATGGWVNENSFYRIRMNTVNIGIDSSYYHNNNRFYDVTLEGGTINLDNSNGNYFRVRAEGGVTVNKTDRTVNTIIERTYDSTKGLFMTNANSCVNSNRELTSFVATLKRQDIVRMNVYNLFWNNSHNLSRGVAHINAWNSGGIDVNLGSGCVGFQSDLYLVFYGKGQRFSFILYDADLNPVPKATEDIVTTGSFNYNSSSHWYSMGTNVNGSVTARIFYKSTTTVKYVYFVVSQGDVAVDIVDCGIYSYVASALPVWQRKTGSRSKTKPTLTTGVPLGFEVYNIGTNTAIEKWVFDGTAWQTCLWASATTPPYTPPTSSSAPTTGTHEVGEIVYNSSPTAGGTIGWVCVTAGTPGTWKAFGTIEA